MKHLHPTRTSIRRSQSAFSLVELLIAIGIIALLAAITIQAVGPALTISRDNATRTTIAKIVTLLDQYRDDVYRGEGDPVALRQVSARQSGCGVAIPDDVAVLYARKLQLKKIIPQRMEDVFARLAGRGDASGFSRASGETDAESLKAESAELLYAFLTGGKVKIDIGGSEEMVEIGNVSLGAEASSGATFKSSELADTDGDGQLELVDGWGEPLRFYRWPTRLIRPNGIGNPPNPNDILKTVMSNVPQAGALNRDPDDSSGDLVRLDQSPAVFRECIGSATENGLDDLTEANFHTPETFHSFLLISAGPDNKLGLEEPSDSASGNFGFLAQPTAEVLADPLNSVLNDSITNLQEDLSK